MRAGRGGVNAGTNGGLVAGRQGQGGVLQHCRVIGRPAVDLRPAPAPAVPASLGATPCPVPTIRASVPRPAPPTPHRPSAPARPLLAHWRPAGLGAAVALAGCSPAEGSTGIALLLGVALPLVAYGFHALGQLRVQRQTESTLRALRQELRLRREIDTAWNWRSDARHGLLQWQGPGQADKLPPPTELATLETALRPLLQPGRSFLALPLHLPAPLASSAAAGRHWRVSACACVDDTGAFDGFVGRAESSEAEHHLQATAASLQAALAVAGGGALAWDEGTGYVIQQLATPTLAPWPGAAPGRPLAECVAPLGEPVAAALRDIARQPAGTRLDVAGWQLQRFDAAPGVDGLWLAPLPAAAPSGGSEAEQFSMTVSHDLRAPIRVVEGFTRIVKEDYGQLLDRVGNDHLDRVLGAAARMNLMIDALLTLARLSTQPLARQPVNLSQLAQYVVEDLRRHAPERQADIEIEPNLTAHGDPTLLRLVLENLLGNAWKYTSRCARTQIALRTVMQGAQRSFEVRDNGAGFDMRSADRLFGLFQRLHSTNDFPGHGVGLASVRRIVQRHGGTIWAEAEVGRGAVFHFTLPG